jgi:hypothetical protein
MNFVALRQSDQDREVRREMNIPGFGIGASPRAESRFLPMLRVDELDLGFAHTILSLGA